ncbi:MAG: hypothetical protein WCI88_12770, partial [Chloroflexota bacterium]
CSCFVEQALSTKKIATKNTRRIRRLDISLNVCKNNTSTKDYQYYYVSFVSFIPVVFYYLYLARVFKDYYQSFDLRITGIIMMVINASTAKCGRMRVKSRSLKNT